MPNYTGHSVGIGGTVQKSGGGGFRAVKCDCGDIQTINTEIPGKKVCGCGRMIMITSDGHIEHLSKETIPGEAKGVKQQGPNMRDYRTF